MMGKKKISNFQKFQISKSFKFLKVSNNTSHSKSHLKVSNKQTRLETRCAIKIWNFSQLCIKPTGFLVEYLSNKVGPSCPLESMVISILLKISMVKLLKTLHTALIVKK